VEGTLALIDAIIEEHKQLREDIETSEHIADDLGEKTALIDTVDSTMPDVLINHLSELGVKRIDYVVANHAEQDHSGAIPQVLEKYPEAKVVCTPKCKDMLIDLLMIPDAKFITVNDRETISLGDRTLEFIHAPWVHWPETMLTYLRGDKILFPCDFRSRFQGTG